MVFGNKVLNLVVFGIVVVIIYYLVIVYFEGIFGGGFVVDEDLVVGEL